MGEAKVTEAVERRGIPVLHIVVVVLLTWIAFAWAYVTRVGSGAKYWVVTGAWLPWIYLVMLAAYVGKKLGKTLDKTLLVAIIFIFGIFTAKSYYFAGVSEVNFISNMAATFSASLSIGVWPPDASRYIRDLLPSWLVVWDPVAAGRYYRGGGEPIWAAYAAPIAAWSLIFIALALQMLPLSFMLLGPEFCEVERLPFPVSMPSRFVINATYTQDPASFGELFFNPRKYRIFWIGATVGFLLNLPYIASQILPTVPWGAYIGGGYGLIPITSLIPNIVQIVQTVFPNAIWITSNINLPAILIFMLVPFEITTSNLIWLIGLGWIYPGIATRMGLMPVGANPWWTGPLPLFWAYRFGSNLGLGLIVLYLLRRRISDLIGLFRKGGEMGGVPVRAGVAMLILGILIFVAIWSAAGLDPFTSFLLWLLFTITTIGGAYYYAQVYTFGAHCVGNDLWKAAYTISSSLGLLPRVPTPGHKAAAVFGYYVATMGTCAGAFQSNSMYNASIITTIYSIGADTRADLRRLFIYVLTALVVLPPFAFAFNAWFGSHVGIVNTSHSGMDVNWWNPASAAMDLGVRSITWNAGPIPIPVQAAATTAWALVIFACYFITARFPILSYFLHPLGVANIGIENYGWCGWVTLVIALTAKYLLVRVLGAKRAYEIIAELVAGVAVGFGLLYIVLGAYVFFTLSIPTIAALWR